MFDITQKTRKKKLQSVTICISQYVGLFSQYMHVCDMTQKKEDEKLRLFYALVPDDIKVLYVDVYMHVYICMCVYICICVYTIHIDILYVCIYIRINVYKFIHVCIFIFTWMHTCIDICVYICI